MKKSKILRTLLTLPCISLLAACDTSGTNNGPQTIACEHTFSDQYSSDETNHWKECLSSTCKEVNSKASHEWDEGRVTTEATTTNEGVKTYTCTVCGQTKNEAIPATGEDDVHTHSWSSTWSKDANYHWKKCTDNTCNEVNNKAQHTFGDWIIDNYAEIMHDASGNQDIVTKVGNKHRVCSVCQYSETATHNDEAPLAEHTHTFDNVWQHDDNKHWQQCSFGKTTGYGGKDKYVCEVKRNEGSHTWDNGVETKAPTTTSEGIKTYTCSVCKTTKQESIPVVVDHTDGSESITVSFNKLEGKQAATVNEKTKAYLDAMKAAEPSIANPYKIQTLNNGVDVCDYLNKDQYKDSEGQGHNKPQGVKVSWTKGSMDYSSATIKYSTKADMSDALEVATSGTQVTLNNLYANTKYYYQLTYTKGTTLYKSNIESFETADYIRFIDMGLVYNVRDMGNYKTSYGGRTKQGLIYRGSELTPQAYNDQNGSHPKNIDADVLSLQKNVLKIAVEIDHRSASESRNLTASPLGSDVAYKRDGYKVSAYDSFVTGNNSSDIQNIYKEFANADQKHVYFHCIGGADRTGCVAFVLLGLLGVSYSDAIADFEVTTSTNWPRCRNVNDSQHYSRFPDFYNTFTNSSKNRSYDSSKSFKDNCEAFLKWKGVSEQIIEKIRSVMIEGYNGTGGETGQETGGNENPPVSTEHTYQTHQWGSETKVSTSGCVDIYTSSCSCGKKKISFKAVDGTLASGSSNNNSSGYLKLKSNGNSVSYKINLPEAVNGKIYFYGYMDSWSSNGSKSYFSGNNTGSTKADQNGNFKLEIDGTPVDFSAMKGVTYSNIFTGSGSNSDEGYAEIGAVNLTAGSHSVVFTRIDSYNVINKNFVIIY